MLRHVWAKMGPAVENSQGHEVLPQEHGDENPIFLRDKVNGLATFFLDEERRIAICRKRR